MNWDRIINAFFCLVGLAIVLQSFTGPNGIKGAFDSGWSIAELLFGIFLFVGNLILAFRATPKNVKDSIRDEDEIMRLNL